MSHDFELKLSQVKEWKMIEKLFIEAAVVVGMTVPMKIQPVATVAICIIPIEQILSFFNCVILGAVVLNLQYLRNLIAKMRVAAQTRWISTAAEWTFIQQMFEQMVAGWCRGDSQVIGDLFNIWTKDCGLIPSRECPDTSAALLNICFEQSAVAASRSEGTYIAQIRLLLFCQIPSTRVSPIVCAFLRKMVIK